MPNENGFGCADLPQEILQRVRELKASASMIGAGQWLELALRDPLGLLPKLLSQLSAGGFAVYRGYLPIETLSRKSGEPDYDPKARAAQLLKDLRAAIRQPE